MRLNLSAKFENLEDDEVYKDENKDITSKVLIIRALNNGISLRVPPGQAGGCDQKTRAERGALCRRVKKANGHVSITVAEGEIIEAASHDALIPAFLHAQLCELIAGCDPEPKPKE